MNIENIYRRIFGAGAVGTAFGYLLALRFNSWWWLCATIPITLALYGPWEMLTAFAKLARAVGENFRRVSTMKQRGELEPIFRRSAERFARASKLLLKIVVVGGALGVGSVIGSFFAFSLFLHPTKESAFGDLLGAVLLQAFAGIACLIALMKFVELVNDVDDKALLFPILKRSLTKPIESDCWGKITDGLLENFLEKNLSALFETKGVCMWHGPDGEILRLSRLARLLGTALFAMAWPAVVALILVFTLVNIALAVFDLALTILLHLSTSGSVAAVTGACLGAGSEYLLYPTFTLAAEDVFRFAVFMVIGGLVGCGIYALRRFLLRSAGESQLATV